LISRHVVDVFFSCDGIDDIDDIDGIDDGIIDSILLLLI